MSSPDPARPVSVKQEEPQDQPDLNMELDEAEPMSSTAEPPVGGKRGGDRPRNSGPAADPPVWHDTKWQPKDIPFTAVPGPRNSAADLQSDQPVDFLELFMSDELLQTICVQTNLYAEQSIRAEESRHPHGKTHVWKDVTVVELKNFFGLLFLTGIVCKPELELYWSTDIFISSPYFSKTMSRNRFQIIWKFLQFSDTDSVDAADLLYEMRPVLDYLLAKFRDMFLPSENISIDEGILLWRGHPAFREPHPGVRRGRLAFQVYNPQKPINYGIKSYILSDSETGYCFNMKPYCGEYCGEYPSTVVSLLDGLAGYGYRLYTDNYYNSVQMCQLLLGLQTHACGTLKKNRGEPPAIREVTNSGLKIGERVMCHNDTVMLLAWRGKRIVRMVTTLHKDETQTVLVKQKGHREKVPQEKPVCVTEYIQNMNGLNRLDENISFYPFVSKTDTLTNKFAVFLFKICLFNAFIIYKAKNPDGSCKCLQTFIQSVVKSWTTLRHAPAAASDDSPAVV